MHVAEVHLLEPFLSLYLITWGCAYLHSHFIPLSSGSIISLAFCPMQLNPQLPHTHTHGRNSLLGMSSRGKQSVPNARKVMAAMHRSMACMLLGTTILSRMELKPLSMT